MDVDVLNGSIKEIGLQSDGVRGFQSLLVKRSAARVTATIRTIVYCLHFHMYQQGVWIMNIDTTVTLGMIVRLDLTSRTCTLPND